MSEATCLIDLSMEESSNLLLSQPPIPLQPNDMIIGFSKRDSLDNNPFDHALKQVNLLNDPFEIVFNEQRKQLQSNSQSVNNNNNVQTANLIGTNDDYSYLSQNKINDNNIMLCSNNTTSPTIVSADCSPITADSPIERSSNKSITNLSSSMLNKGLVSTSSPANAAARAIVNHKNITGKRSPFSASFRERINSDGSLNLSLSSKFHSIRNTLNDSTRNSLLMNETPSIEDSFEDQILMNEQLNLVDSDADSDIEQMKIPFLKKESRLTEIQQPTVSLCDIEEQLEKLKSIFVEDGDIVIDSTTDHQPSVDNVEINNKSSTSTSSKASSTNIDTLLDDLKKVVEQCENEKTKSDATALLTNLGAVLNNGQQMNVDDDNNPKPTASIITRQGTFNMDDEDSDIKSTINDDDEHANRTKKFETVSDVTPKRSQSLSTKMKPNSVFKAIETKQKYHADNNSFATPVRSIVPRRNSFSEKSSIDRPNLMMRRSIYSMKNESPKNVSKFHHQSSPMPAPNYTLRQSSMTPSRQSFQKQAAITTTTSSAVQSTFPGARRIIGSVGGASGTSSRLRVKAIETRTKTGPLKATIPIKAVAPLHVSTIAVPPQPSPIETIQKRLLTSTPNAVEFKSKQSAYSRPINNVSKMTMPTNSNRRHSSIATPIKNRATHVSVTPNPVKIGRIERQRSFTNLNTQSLYAAAANTTTFGGGKTIDQNLMKMVNVIRFFRFSRLFLLIFFILDSGCITKTSVSW